MLASQLFVAAHLQLLATQYVYSYLGNEMELCFSLLSDDLNATIIRDGNIAFQGGKKEFEAFMATFNFGTMKNSNNNP